MKYLSYLLITLLFALIFSCNTTEPPIDDSALSLSVEDVSCTEAWLKLSTQNLGLPKLVTFSINESAEKAFYLQTNDTIIYVDSLSPSQNYTFQAVAVKDKIPVVSREAIVRTLDTTSHNFTWQTWTFGDFASSYFSDVAIIDENNIWAVGQIFLYDSLGNVDPHAYNLAIFDGRDWELKRIPFIYEGSEFYGPIYSIFSFNKNDIWLGIGSMIHWNGEKFNSIKIPDETFPSRVNAIWGTSSEDLYIVGNYGNIAHYNGSGWQKIESGTDTDLYDIWGNKDFVIVTGYKELYQISSFNKTLRIEYEPQRRLRSVWHSSTYKIFTAGEGIFSTSNLNKWEKEGITDEYMSFQIRGTEMNNIWSTGGFGFTAYFNGINWMEVEKAKLNHGNYYSLDVSDKQAVLVGTDGIKAIIKKGSN